MLLEYLIKYRSMCHEGETVICEMELSRLYGTRKVIRDKCWFGVLREIWKKSFVRRETRPGLDQLINYKDDWLVTNKALI